MIPVATRRVKRSLVAVGAVTLVAAAAASLIMKGDGPCAELGPVQSFELDTVTRIDCVPAFVVNRRGDFSVFLARAPHLRNEPLEWDDRQRLFVSPFHGESFSAAGRKVEGPGAHEMFRCPWKERDGMLTIEAPPDSSIEELRAICGYDELPP